MIAKFFKISFWKNLFIVYQCSNLIEGKNYSKAIEKLEKYLKEKKFITEAIYYWLGYAYIGTKDYLFAEKSLGISLKYQKREDIYKANTYFLLGLVYYEQELFNKACDNFKHAIEIKENLKGNRDNVISLSNLYWYLGKSFIGLGEKGKAVLSLNKGFEIDKNNEVIKNTLLSLKNEAKS